ncbi:TPA: LysR family transcriptional regulator [Escherichia coli]
MNNALYNQIRIFQSIAREGNISAAARKLEITPPSVSNALKLLEEYIGHPLFVRTTRRIELTETGQFFIPVMESYWKTYPPVYLYYPKNAGKTKRVKALIDFLISTTGR